VAKKERKHLRQSIFPVVLKCHKITSVDTGFVDVFSLFTDQEISKKTSKKIFSTDDVDVAQVTTGAKTFRHRRLDV